MDNVKIYKLASELTGKQVKNILSGWKSRNEKEKIMLYNSLVRLGDSNSLACATVMLKDDEVLVCNQFSTSMFDDEYIYLN